MSLARQSDEHYMARAIKLARRAWGETHPNPMVGAVIVENGEIIAEGWHSAAGMPHAEIEALTSLAKAPPETATLYITLEPCSTHGRTGACTEAIIKSGIRRVVVGAVDPNPAHVGKGLDILREARIELVSGVLAEECSDLNLIFNHWITSGSPLLAAKMAMTLDGKFAAASGHSQWVTSEAARADVMQWRRYFPAIAVGANTVAQDNPSLTSRIGDKVHCPRRFVFDRQLKTAALPEAPQLFTDAHRSQTVVLCSRAAGVERKEKLRQLDIDIWELPEADGHLDWSAFREFCADAGIYGVYIETGPELATAAVEQGKVDYLFIYKAAKLMADSTARGIGSARNTASMADALELENVRHTILGEDVLTRGFLKK